MSSFKNKYKFNVSRPGKSTGDGLIEVWHGRHGYLWIPNENGDYHGHMDARILTRLAKDWLENRPKKKGAKRKWKAKK